VRRVNLTKDPIPRDFRAVALLIVSQRDRRNMRGIRCRILDFVTLILLWSLLFYSGAQAQPTSVQPSQISAVYQVDSLANRYWIAQYSGSWGSSFVQTADIDAPSDSSWNSGTGFTPIGNSATFFTGMGDGGGHSITGLFIYPTTDNLAGY